jgi:DNA-binding CsgD family transcriptional regulator
MDPRRFDQLTQGLARKLSSGKDGERNFAAQTVREIARSLVSRKTGGTCPYPEPATALPNEDWRSSAAAVTGPDAPSISPGTSVRQPHRRRQRVDQVLSPREEEVARLIGQGLRNREIAAALVLSERTVHAHVRNLLDKLELTSRAQIAAWATAHGLLQQQATAATVPMLTKPIRERVASPGLTSATEAKTER